jgi:SNF2 family DNA or RNA helicase
VSLSEGGEVLFQKPEQLADSEWERFKSHWDQTASRLGDEGFSISTQAFLHGKDYLRHGWTAFGSEYRVELSSEARALLLHAKSSADEWRSACVGANESDDLNLSGLGLKRTLTTFQARDLSLLASMNSGANFSVPGAGKTSVTLSLWALLKSRADVNKLLVVAPKSAFEAWIEVEPAEVFESVPVAAVFSGGLISASVEILVCNYEQLESDTRIDRLKDWIIRNSAMLVLDEAHRVKGGAASVRWRGCAQLAAVARRVDLLTGTPMPQSFKDLTNLFSLSWPCVPKSLMTERHLSSLGTGSVFVRTTKTELNLPPVELRFELVEMGDIQSQVYSALRKSYAGTFDLPSSQEAFFSSKGKAVMTLIAAATNPALLMGLREEEDFVGLSWPPEGAAIESSLLDVVGKYLKSEIPPKYEWVRRYCEKASLEGRKVLVWSNFVGNLRALERILKPLNPAVIYGGTPNDDRRTELRRFRSSEACSVLLTNPQTLGEGVSLHKECHECIFVDRLYNAGLYLQALDRIHRLGLAADQLTRVHVLQSRNSIDVRVGYRLEAKIVAMSDALNDSGLVKSSVPEYSEIVPEDLVGLDHFDAEDLFGHLVSG